jgi:hypothetical protein
MIPSVMPREILAQKRAHPTKQHDLLKDSPVHLNLHIKE